MSKITKTKAKKRHPDVARLNALIDMIITNDSIDGDFEQMVFLARSGNNKNRSDYRRALDQWIKERL
jgi:hypothetical protein